MHSVSRRGVSYFHVYFSDSFGILGQKEQLGVGGKGQFLKENSQSRPLCLLELLSSTFNLAKFHPAGSSGKLGLTIFVSAFQRL